MRAPEGSGESVISLPKRGGAIKAIGETSRPDLFTGTGNYAVPSATTPGRNGFGPSLSLRYSSVNGTGPFGLGWALAAPRVTRKTEKGLPRYDDEDVFVLTGAEDLVSVIKEHPITGEWLTAEARRQGDHLHDQRKPDRSRGPGRCVDHLHIAGYHDKGLLELVEQAAPKSFAPTRHFAARGMVPDAYYAFDRSDRL